MRVISRSSLLIVIGVALTVGTVVSLAQQDQGGGPPGRGNFDPAQMQERMMERYKEAINATDDEWKAISPMIETVMEKQRASFAGGRGMFGMGGPGGRMGRGGQGGQGGGQNAPQGGQQGRRMGGQGGPGGPFGGTPMPEVEALRTALDKEDTPAADIEAKLKNVRTARKAREADLQKAREELRKVLKIRQEAQLVLMGLLD